MKPDGNTFGRIYFNRDIYPPDNFSRRHQFCRHAGPTPGVVTVRNVHMRMLRHPVQTLLECRNLKLLRRALQQCQRGLKCRRGVASVEFALVVAPFLLLVFGFIGLNMAFYTRSSMQNTAALAARMMSTGQIKNNVNGVISAGNATSSSTCGGGLTTAQVEYYACNGLPTWATYTVTTTQDCAVPSVAVQITASAFTAAAGDAMDVLVSKTVRARVVAMKEGACP